MAYTKPSGERMHNLHIRIPYAVWRKFRSLYPDKGDVQKHGLIAVLKYIGWPTYNIDVAEDSGVDDDSDELTPPD